MTRHVRWIIGLLLLVLASAALASPPDEATRVVQQIEADPNDLFDLHGNADERLQRLMVLRFDATPAVQAGIDRLEHDPKQADLVAALYYVLGFVKDPASIPWLQGKLHSSSSQSVHANYIPLWLSSVGFGIGDNPGFGDWPWLTGREQWISFFLKAHEREGSPVRRAVLLNILKGFDDPSVMQFFQAYRQQVRDPREMLLVETYLYQHDVPSDGARIALAIKALEGEDNARELLLGTADALRHEAYVPYLIKTYDVANKRYSPPWRLSQDVLEEVTLQLDIKDKAGWETWYAAHRDETRAQWVQAATESFRTKLQRNPSGAKQTFTKAVYRWDDIAFLPFVRLELVPRPSFHDDVAGWINLTYTPFHRARMEPVAEAVARNPEQLEDWAQNLLRERGFLPSDRKDTWADVVSGSSSAL